MPIKNLVVPKQSTEELRAEAEGRQMQPEKMQDTKEKAAPPVFQATLAKSTQRKDQATAANMVSKADKKTQGSARDFLTYSIILPVPAPGTFAKFDKACETFEPSQAALKCFKKGYDGLAKIMLDGLMPDYNRDYEHTGTVVETTRRVPIEIHRLMIRQFDEMELMSTRELGKIMATCSFVHFMEN